MLRSSAAASSVFHGWRAQLDNTFQFVLWASFGSAAIHLINVKQRFADRQRGYDTRIAVLRDIIDRVGRGEDVDVGKELRVGEREGEQDWEDMVRGIEERLDRQHAAIRRNSSRAAHHGTASGSGRHEKQF